ncbi:DNA internalization-related competence protein ComEC/Rec2 [Piscirickettsia litoralis]|uniref:DNA internalization-related competence protein ComEC/Rec2 n=1 Tax=Piscirickettsia litoralis TaxID=1891921 RepID=A0ABX2ZZ37_9GAMM|nr:DNA internalization-related competence protein ComEC/Rec2 [Piscirickettsia litoralis]ODN41896.1 DNA internalization-related competence protein ComEC/Rec2 [Piscirickettsia litoralis]
MMGFVFVIGFITLFFLGWPGGLLLSFIIGGLYYFIKSSARIWWVLFLCLGALWALLVISWQNHLRLSHDLFGHSVQVTGIIHSIPEYQDRKTRFLFVASEINGQTLWPKRALGLNWYKPRKDQLVLLHAGERWRFNVKLRPPTGLENFIGFNYRLWLYQQGIQATGTVTNKEGGNTRLSGPHALHIQKLRQQVARFLEDAHLQNSAVIKALTLGERGDLSQNQRQILQQTGTAHLLAVSGLHIGLIVTFTFLLMRVLLLWLPLLAKKYQNSGYALFIAAVISLMAAILYSALAGFSIATLRACLMTSCILIAFLYRRVIPIWTFYQYALVGVILFFPLSVLSVGFWLSFISVAVLIFVCSGRLKQNKLQKYIKPQWALLIALGPLSLAYFFNLPIMGLFANLVAIPWTGALILPILLMSVIFIPLSLNLALILLNFADQQITWLLQVLHYLNQLQFYIPPYHGIPKAAVLIISLLGTFILLMPRGLPGRFLGGIALFIPWLYAVKPIVAGDVFIRVLDVGQGFAAIIKTSHHNLIYDVGNRTKSGFDLGQAVVVPNLYALGVRHINKLVISHIDSDHSGGLSSVLAIYPQTKVISSSPLLPSSQIEPCVSGNHWQWDGVKFEFLSPFRPFPYGRNNQSCVLKITAKGKSVLFSGDIEKSQEKKLIARAPLSLKSDILFAPHHGSKSSSTLAFIKTVSPNTVIISAGRYNAYKLPHSVVIDRYQQQKVNILNTGQVGAIDFELTNGPIGFTFAGS